jgi:hypothetical protein
VARYVQAAKKRHEKGIMTNRHFSNVLIIGPPFLFVQTIISSVPNNIADGALNQSQFAFLAKTRDRSQICYHRSKLNPDLAVVNSQKKRFKWGHLKLDFDLY